MLSRILALLGEYHERYPLRAGMPREELKSRLGLSVRAFNQAVSRASRQGKLAETETLVALQSHRVELSPGQQQQVSRLLSAFDRSPYSPPTPSESEALVGPDVLAALIQQGRLVRVSDSVLLSASAYQEMTEAVIRHFEDNSRVTLAQVRDMFGTSRKYAQALLEHLDQKRVTKRVGDERLLL
jgi:selenocysteine-specific elongation factor